ncbi:hypothetical protein OG754_40005 (plasmid) [Streptomyces decoyicus]|uniref:hypothetical protein n=1 Tax=Streptomyces decoyicus TaxID=249567 RepID=UPI002E360083|nr:hypothetical protein [Streptomyces decoyicus]
MHRTAAPDFGGAPLPALRLERAVHLVLPRGEHRIDDAFSARHFTDLTGAYGRTYRPDLVPGGAGNDFATMSRLLVESLRLADEPVGAAIVAHATPDLDCRRAAATYLSDAWSHGPLAFGVSEQGGVTPFSALGLAGACARRHALSRVLVLVLDQASLPYDTGTDLARDAGVGLLLAADDAPGIRPSARVTPGVAAQDVQAELARQLAPSLAAGPVTLVAGPGIDPGRDVPDAVAEVRTTPKGFLCTGLWAELARPFAAGERPVLVDRDPLTGDLGVCRTADAGGAS